MHPYEIASLLRARGKDDDMEIKWGSLYTVVRNLAKHGFIEVVDSRREGARPERTIYRITDAGRAELRDWTRELVATPQPEHPRFKAGLSVLAALTPDEAMAALRERVASWSGPSRRSGRCWPRTRTCRGCSSSRPSTSWRSARPSWPGCVGCWRS